MIINNLINSSTSIYIFNEFLNNYILIFTDESLDLKYIYNDSDNNIKHNITSFSKEQSDVNVIDLCSNVKIGVCMEKGECKNKYLNDYYSAAYPVAQKDGKVLGYIGLFSRNRFEKYPYILILEIFSKLILKEIYKKQIIEQITWKFHVEFDIAKETGLAELTNRECEVVELITENCMDYEISERLGISLSTVRSHINNIFKKTKTNSKLDLINLILKNNLKDLKDKIESI